MSLPTAFIKQDSPELNPFVYWKRRKQRLERRVRFQDIRRELTSHSMMSLVVDQIDLEEIEKRWIRRDFFTMELIYLMQTRKLLHPVLLYSLWNKVQREAMDWVEFPHNRQIAVPVLSLCVSAFASTGSTGMGCVISFMEKRETSQALRFLASFQGLRQKGFRELFTCLEEMLSSSGDIDSLVYFLEEVIKPEMIERFKVGLFVNATSLPGLTTRFLVDIAREIRTFKKPETLLRGISLVDLRGNANTRFGLFFASCLEETRCSEGDLKKAIDLVKHPKRAFEKVDHFEDRIRLMLILVQNGIDPDLQKQAAEAMEDCNGAAWVFFRELMLHYRDQLDENLLSGWLMLKDLASLVFPAGRVTTAFVDELPGLVRQDDASVFPGFCDIIRNTNSDGRHSLFKLAVAILDKTRSVDVLGVLVELNLAGTLEPNQFLKPGISTEHQAELEDLVINVCQSRCLHNLLLNGGYDPEEYLYTLNQLMVFCEEPVYKGRFIRNLKKALSLGVKLDDYFHELMQARTTLGEFIKASHPGKLTRLEFEEVQPFLRHYATALLGNIPISQSQNGVPHTDGGEIFLPDHENRFPDCKSDLYTNRNASLYVANLFHEIGFHILAGTFLVDFRPTINRFSNRELAHTVFNVFEDYRGREHFLSQPYPKNWKKLIRQDERIITRSMPTPDNWKLHFMQLFVAKGTSGITPGELDPLKKTKEVQLLKKKIDLFTPGGRQQVFTLREILDLIISKTRSLKGKTAADSLLLVKPVYSILSQVLGEDFSLPGNSPGLSADINGKTGKDAFETCPGTDREQQLTTLAGKIQPLQGARNVPARVESEKRKSAGNGDASGRGTSQDSASGEFRPGDNTVEKAWFGEYDHVSGKEMKNPYPVILKRESGYHPQFELLYQKYHSVFQAMEQAMKQLQEEKEALELEGRNPDDIIIENLIEGLADPQSIPFLDLYENEVRPEQEQLTRLEVKILVDASGSTSGTVLEVEKVFAAVMFRAMKSLEFDVELYFFNGDKETHIYQVSNLDAIGRIRSGYANRDGAAIRFVTQTFKGSGDRSLLIMITDGMPEADNYHDEKAMRDTCHAMKSAADRGIMVRYFNIGGLPDKILQAFQEHTHHSSVFYKPSDLVDYAPGFVQELMKEMEE